MNEFVPVFIAFVFGSLIWRLFSGSARIVLCAIVVIASGSAATLLSGEYQESWLYFLLDFAEASAGLAAAIAAAVYLPRRRPLFALPRLSSYFSRLLPGSPAQNTEANRRS